jgi:voltage-gated potassium channel
MTRESDLLQVFTGVASADVVDAVRRLIARREEVEGNFVEGVTAYPLESLTVFLFTSSVAFYLAERDENPKVKTFVDAVYYISTCLSVGYADIFAQTQKGRAIATLVMTVGPALAAEAFDPPGRATSASRRDSEILAEKLDAILEELKRQGGDAR